MAPGTPNAMSQATPSQYSYEAPRITRHTKRQSKKTIHSEYSLLLALLALWARASSCSQALAYTASNAPSSQHTDAFQHGCEGQRVVAGVFMDQLGVPHRTVCADTLMLNHEVTPIVGCLKARKRRTEGHWGFTGDISTHYRNQQIPA